VLPTDILEVVEAYYMDTAGTTLNGDITDVDPPALGDILYTNTPLDLDDFSASGTLLIDQEQISYTAIAGTAFTGITRGVGGTTPHFHLSGAAITQYPAKKWSLLEPRTTRQLADLDPEWLSAADGVPTQYYIFPNVLGFEIAPNKAGYFNIMLRNLIRPPEMATDASIITGLIVTFYKAIVHYGAAKLAQILAQDEAAVAQSTAWFQEYLGDIAVFKQNQHLYTRGLRSQLIPKVNRPSGF
jgi:hypothetical protein